jgi:hypothetical protein
VEGLMLRSQQHILENRLEVLGSQSRTLSSRTSTAQARLAEEKARYEALANHWQSVGLSALFGPEELSVVQSHMLRSFAYGLASGLGAVMLLALLFLI